MKPLRCADCWRDLRTARGGVHCRGCSRYGASRVSHARRRLHIDWQGIGVALLTVLCGSTGLGLEIAKGGALMAVLDALERSGVRCQHLDARGACTEVTTHHVVDVLPAMVIAVCKEHAAEAHRMGWAVEEIR
jgi:hypothetical protein